LLIIAYCVYLANSLAQLTISFSKRYHMTIKKVTKDAVYQACESCLQEGIDLTRITNAMVYKKVGSIGSYSTIGPYLKEWKDEKLSHHLSTFQVPREVELTGDDFIRKIWQIALDHAYKNVEGKLASYDNLVAELDDLEKTITDKEDESDVLNGEIDELNLNMRDTQLKFVTVINNLRDSFNTHLGIISSSINSKDTEKIIGAFNAMRNSMKELFDESLTDQQKILNDYISKATVGANNAASTTEDIEIVDDALRSEQATILMNQDNEI